MQKEAERAALRGIITSKTTKSNFLGSLEGTTFVSLNKWMAYLLDLHNYGTSIFYFGNAHLDTVIKGHPNHLKCSKTTPNKSSTMQNPETPDIPAGNLMTDLNPEQQFGFGTDP